MTILIGSIDRASAPGLFSFIDYFDHVDLRWIGATWSIVGGVKSNNPGVGSNLLTTGDMESGSPPTGYAAINSGTVARVSDPRTGSAGSYALSVIRGSPGATDSARNVSFRGVITNGDWFILDGWLKTDGTAGHYARFYLLGASSLPFSPMVGSLNGEGWLEYKTSGRCNTAVGGDVYFNLLPAAAEARYDDLTVKKITFANLFSFLPRNSIANLGLKMTFVFVVSNDGMQQGLAARWDSPTVPANGIICYYNGDNQYIYCDQLVSGTWTNLSKTNASSAGLNYGANGVHSIYLEISGVTCKIYFNETLLDTVSIDASLASNKYNGLFSTAGAVSSFTMQSHETKTFTFIGDSITASSVSFSLQVPRKYPGLNKINMHGVTGAVVIHDGVNTDMADEVAAAVADNADIIVVEFGVNDPGNGAVGAPYLANIQALQASNPNAEIYALEILPVRDNNSAHDAKRALIQAACATAGITYWDTSDWIIPATDCGGDGIHPNFAGHTKIAAQILARLD